MDHSAGEESVATSTPAHVLERRLHEVADFSGQGAREALLEAVRSASGASSARLLWAHEVIPDRAEVLHLPLSLPSRDGSPRVLELVGATPESADLDLVQFCSALLAAQNVAEGTLRGERRHERRRSAVNQVVRAAVEHRDVNDVLAVAVEALRAGMLCQGVAIRAFDAPESPLMERYAAYYPPEAEPLMTEEVLDISGRAVRICWEHQSASLLHIDEPDVEPLTTEAERDLMFELMRAVGAREMLMAPMGAGNECQGWITLTRLEEHDPFGAEDVEVMLAIGRELGNVIKHARAFERQRDLIERLRDLDAHKNRFTATLAHQLNNPLASVQGHAEMVREMVQSEVDSCSPALRRGAKSLDAIDRAAARMRQITGSILALARLQEPERPLDAVEVQLDGLIRSAIDVSQQSALANDIRLDGSAVTADVSVLGAPDELDMVVDNLISNAVKYGRPGTTVRLALQAKGDGAAICCEDEGIGMSEEDVDQLFEAFHRADEARQREIQGTGLGMAIVASAVERHQGRVHVESQLGVGTRICVWLPSRPMSPEPG